MLKLSIDVHSGIMEFKDRVVSNSDNRDIFLQGILLYLMGERVSLHAFDGLSDEEKQPLIDFLDKVELKGVTTPAHKCVDVMLFQQHKKDGVPRFGAHHVKDGKLWLDTEHNRLNATYAKFIKRGLFDMFALSNDDLMVYLDSWREHRTMLINDITDIINNDLSYDTKMWLLKPSLESLIESLHNCITKCGISVNVEIGSTPYDTTMQWADAAAVAQKLLFSKRKGIRDAEKERARLELELQQLRMTLFAHQYMLMFFDLFDGDKKPTNCSKFGHSLLDMKSKKTVQAYLESLINIDKPIVDKRSSNNATEFYKSMMQASSYGVATISPVKAVRYDGKIELYVNSDRETLLMILERIRSSHRYYLNVGKRSFGRLRPPAGLMPPNTFNDVKDDVKDVILES